MIFCDFYFAFITSQNQKDFIVSVLVWSISFLIALQHTILNQNQSLTCAKKKLPTYFKLGFTAVLWLKKDSPMCNSYDWFSTRRF